MAYLDDDLKRMGIPRDAPRNFGNVWRMINPRSSNPALNLKAHRLNCLGSFYYFMKIGLKKDRLYAPLHGKMCVSLERPALKEIIEYPRDHFKSTIHSEGFPIWRSLPFTEDDERTMRLLHYTDDFIQWMRYAHDQDNRILLISEIKNNAVKLGTRIRGHYENNDFFGALFPEILPNEKCVWTNESLQHRRTPKGSIQGEGTYDFLGVGNALQSRHYKMVVQDDLVGKDALKSPTVMQGTIEYHQLLVGAFDSVTDYGVQDNDEIIVGNRWAYSDLNSYVRTNEPYFTSRTHSALGGCCAEHPIGVPIFPTEFSVEKLERWRQRLGSYLFSCQFLNDPVNPDDVKFDTQYLRYFKFEINPSQYEPELSLYGQPTGKKIFKVQIKHQPKDGQVLPNVNPAKLSRAMIIDPNHAGNAGRCRHAINVTGWQSNPRRIYLLDVWAKSCSIEEFIQTIFNMARTWKIKDIYLETIAAQKYLLFHLNYVKKERQETDDFYRSIRFHELHTPKTENAKAVRIESFGVLVERGEFFINESGQQEFLEEYKTYPAGKLKDVLDTLGYGPQVWDKTLSSKDDQEKILAARLKEYQQLSSRSR